MIILRLHYQSRSGTRQRAFGLRDDGDLAVFYLEDTMMEHEQSDLDFAAVTSRLLRREALYRAANELNTTSGPGLESVLARISAEVTAEAAGRTSPPVSPLLVEKVRKRRDKP